MRKHCLLAVTFAVALATGSAEASPLTYDVNATFDNGLGTIVGSFTIDYVPGATSDAVTAVNIQTSAAGLAPATNAYYVANSGFSEYGGTATEYPTSTVFIFTSGALVGGTTYNGPAFDLSFVFPAGGALASYGFGASDLWVRSDGGQSTFYNVSGTATPVTSAVPETSTWAMLLLGFAGVGLLASGRRRGSRGFRFA